MSRNIYLDFIQRIEPNIETYKNQFEIFISQFPPEMVATEILSTHKNNETTLFETTLNKVNYDLTNNRALYLLMQKLFNRHGKKSDLAKNMIILLIESVVFDLFMDGEKTLCKHNPKAKDTLTNILDMFNEIYAVKRFKRRDILDDNDISALYLTDLYNSDTRTATYERGKHVFHIYMAHLSLSLRKATIDEPLRNSKNVNYHYIYDFIKRNYKKTDVETRLIILKCTAAFFERLNCTSISLLEKLKCLYALKTYEQNLCSIIYSVIFKIEYKRLITEIKRNYKAEEAVNLSTNLDPVRQNYTNRIKHTSDNTRITALFELLDTFCDDKDDYFNESAHIFMKDVIDVTDGLTERKAKEMKRRAKKNDNTIGTIVNYYLHLGKYRTKHACLVKFNELFKDISDLSRAIHRYNPQKSNIDNIYEKCTAICWQGANLIHELGIWDKDLVSNKMHLKIYKDLMRLLASDINWNDQTIPLYEFLSEGVINFTAKETYKSIKLFNRVDTVLVIPYLKSLSLDHQFIYSKDTVLLLVEFLNEVIEYIQKIFTEVYKQKSNCDAKVRTSFLHRDIEKYFSTSKFNDTYSKFFFCWETRKNMGNITFDDIRNCLNKKVTKKIL